MKRTLSTGALLALPLFLGGACRSESLSTARDTQTPAPVARTHVPPVPHAVAPEPAFADAERESVSTSDAPEASQSRPAQSEGDAPEGDAPIEKAPDVIFVPTPQPVVDKMLELAQVKKSDIVYDLGCGDGRIVVTAAKRYGTRAYGFDVDPKRIAEARENVRRNGVGHLVTIEQKDIFTLDLSPADVVTLYLLPELNVKLIPQLEQLAPGARVVSHDFDMAGIRPVAHLKLTPPGTSREHEIYLWHTPLEHEPAPTAE